MRAILASFAFLAGFVFFGVWQAATAGRQNAERPTNQPASEVDVFSDVDISVASPAFSPARVVELQIQSLIASQKDIAALKTCYSLAAPSNRAITGPLDRFAIMLQSPEYDALVTPKNWQVGEARIADDIAAVFVSCVNSEDNVVAFRFILQKQEEAPYVDCWMTVAVQPLAMPDSDARVRGSALEGQIES